jgi:hypothetical protein
MEPKNHRGMRTMYWAGCACLALCASSLGQVVEPMGTFTPEHVHHHTPPGQAPAAPQPATSPAPAQVAPAAAANVPPSLLDKPAQPAKIDLAAGRLAIEANNSSLSEILHQVTTTSGMTVDGLNKDQRVFGSYGPGDPQEVLSSLLHGSGYNVVMLGRTETGAPRQLTLSPRGAGVAHGGPSQPQSTAQEEDNEDEVQAQPEPPPPPENPAQGTPNSGGVRTPQQMLQELQQMRQRQQLPQPTQQPPPQ